MVDTINVPVEYQPGGTWGSCPVCAFKIRLNLFRRDWRGLNVCPDCYDPRPDTLNPPDIRPEGMVRPDAAPEPPDVFIQSQVLPSDL